ncbi:MAG TPA: hypothetical protein VFQ71_01345 [Gaiellales bacterium]|nr:hypothetical protein [Gaiellales bacterium]
MGRRSLTLTAALAVGGWTLLGAAPALAAGWQVAPSASPNSYKNFLQAVVRVPGTGQFWAAGYTLDQVGPTHGLIEHTNGGSWQVSPTASAPGRLLDGIAAASPSRAWAVGTGNSGKPLVLAWNGSSWSKVAVPLPAGASGGSLVGIRAFSGSDVTAVGSWASNTGGGPLVEHWNGATWRATAAPNPIGCTGTLSSVAGVPGSARRFAVGFCLDNVSFASTALVERFSHGSWSIVNAPAPPGSVLDSVTPLSAARLWAVGLFVNGSGVERTLTERWNGAGWSIVPSANAAGGSDWLSSVIAVPGTGTLWAVGDSLGRGAISERWNGTSWSLVRPARPGQEAGFEAAAASPGTTWAVGSFTPSSGGGGPIGRTLAERRAN